MANVQKSMTDVSAKLDRNAFDLSERHLFTAKLGQLLPVYHKQCVPGDYFEIDPVAFLRTAKLNQACFGRMRQHIDFFFVPYSQLWHRFPEFKYQRLDPTTANEVYSAGQKPRVSPYMSLMQVYNQCLGVHESGKGMQENFGDMFGFSSVCNAVRLCDLLGYGSLRNQCIPQEDSPMADPQTDQPYCSDYFYTADASAKAKKVTIWPWLAYQKIWSDYYRNPFYDVDPDPSSFNLDDIQGVDFASADIGLARGSDSLGWNEALSNIFTLRYRQWKKDYFTGLFPDQQFGDVSMVLTGRIQFKSDDDDPFGSTGVRTVVGSVTEGSHDVNVGYTSAGTSALGGYLNWPGVSVLDIRRAELLQVWKEKVMRAGYRSENQQLAHFGVASEYIPDQHVKLLGGVSSILDINEVVSTSIYANELDADGLGEIAGKCTSLANGSTIRFNCKDDGIIMAIYSILPESEYSSFGVEAEHMRIEPFDYFTPAFQNVGFRAVSNVELSYQAIMEQYERIVGYAPPFYDMKMGIDKVHGEFIPENSAIHGPGTPYELTDNAGSLTAFDLARRNAVVAAGQTSFFYVSPRTADTVFAENAGNFEDSDQFYINMYLDIKAVRPMSVLGLPNF